MYIYARNACVSALNNSRRKFEHSKNSTFQQIYDQILTNIVLCSLRRRNIICSPGI